MASGLRTSRGALREGRQGDIDFAHSFGLAAAHQYLSERSLYALLKHFCGCRPGDICRSPDMEVSRVYECGPTGLYMLVYFKGYCCLRIWLPVTLKLGAD